VRYSAPVDPNAIVYPAVAMFLLTVSLVVRMAYLRVTAVQRGEVSIGFYRLYQGDEPERLRQIGRHVQNHFEAPPLFYAAALFLYVTGSVTPLAVALAWTYVALRGVHSFVHLGGNDVRLRLLAYGASMLALTGMWLVLLVSLLTRG
jgi:hypothetical protein